jgi:hypothetical protein
LSIALVHPRASTDENFCTFDVYTESGTSIFVFSTGECANEECTSSGNETGGEG